jgi:hypothetical protein
MPIKRGGVGKNANIEGLCGKFSVKKIFFIRKIPRVEPGRASIHGTYVPWMEGGIRKDEPEMKKKTNFLLSLRFIGNI